MSTTALSIAFIQATNSIDVHWSAPIAFGYLKAYLEQRVATPLHVSSAETAADVVAQAPHLVGVSSLSQDFGEATRIADFVKRNSDALVVLGGQHISAFPQTLPAGVDVGVIGEGEQTFAELVGALIREGKLAERTLETIAGLVFRDGGGQLRATTPRPAIRPLDALPMPDRALGRQAQQRPYLFTSRGCPYRCAFCASTQYWGKMRLHSAERVVAEVEDILRRFPGVVQIPIWDDLFIADRPRLRRIVALLEERRLTGRVSFSCNVRANLINEEVCSLLRRCNVTEASFGAESGSDDILRVLKGGMTVAQNQRALDLLSASGIRCNCSFILGAPGETEDNVNATYEFILRNYREGKMQGHDVNILTPMPGAELWQWAQSRGMVGEAMDWGRLRFLASQCNTVGDLTEWFELRRGNRSVYLNEAVLPQERLYELMLAAEEQRYYNHPRPEVVAQVPPTAKRVLDVGCAAGAVGKALKDRGVSAVIGVEMNPIAARTAAQHLDQVIVGDIEQVELPFPAGHFDCIVLADVLEHLRDPWAATKKLAWHLADGGAIVCSIPNVRNLGVIKALVEGRWTYVSQGILDRTHLRFFTLAEFMKLLADAGLVASRVAAIRDPGLSFSAADAGQRASLDLNLGRCTIRGVSATELEEFAAVQFLVVATKPSAVEPGHVVAGEARSASGKPMRPRVSIVIPVFNQVEYTRQCIESLIENTPDDLYEVIVVDNGSTDGTRDFLGLLEGDVKVITNESNRGFAEACNQGMQAAAGDYTLLLNNDVIVTAGWLERMLHWAETDPAIGIVGPMTNYTVGPQVVRPVPYDGDLRAMRDFARQFAAGNAGQGFAIHAVTGFCMLVKRGVVARIGGMSLRYGKGGFEDFDFCLRASLAGYKVWVAQDVFVHHFGNRTFIGANIDIDAQVEKNWRKFKAKWRIPPQTSLNVGYPVERLLAQPFDPKRHFVPLRATREPMAARTGAGR